MARTLNRLTDRGVRTARAGMYADGGGLWLRVDGDDESLNRRWVFRYATGEATIGMNGKKRSKERQMGLGSVNNVTLAEARERAAECRKQRQQGKDPITEQDAVRAAHAVAAAKLLPFKQCAEDYIEAHRSGWRNEKHAAQWVSTLKTYAYPIIGHVGVADIDTVLVDKVLTQSTDKGPLWTALPSTAKRLRGRIEQVLDYATAKKARSGDNPARWKGNLKHILASHDKSESHQPALPYDELGAFLAEVRPRPGQSAKALEFLILTGTRTNEVIGAKPREFDLKQKTWTIPAARMKAKQEHRVPLCDRAVEILRSLPFGSDFVFAGRKEGKPLSNMAMAELVKQINEEHEERGLALFVDPKQSDRPIVPHGFRSSFEDWAHERTNFPNHVIEMALAHKIKNETEAAYRRGDLFEKRRELMEAWEAHCSARPSKKRKAAK